METLSNPQFTPEQKPTPTPSHPMEALALAALSRQLDKTEETKAETLPLRDDEITVREIQRATLNSRHDAKFFKIRFGAAVIRKDARGRDIVAFSRNQAEHYITAYHEAPPIPDGYQGRTIASFTNEQTPLEAVFEVINDIDMPLRILQLPNGQRAEYIDEDFIELLELGLAEKDLPSEHDEWTPPTLREQFESISVPERGTKRPIIEEADTWNDGTVTVSRIPSRPVQPPHLQKPADPEAIAWQPRYLRNLSPLREPGIPLAHLDPGLGLNALVALAAKHPELAAQASIDISDGQPAISSEALTTLTALLDEASLPDQQIPNNWQSLEDVAKDANIRLDGEDGLAQWVAEGHYGDEHVATIAYKEGRDLKGLTFCSPQLARSVVDWVRREQARLERAIELLERYDTPDSHHSQLESLPEISHEESEVVEAENETREDPIEALRERLQSLETFAAMRHLDTHWTYELADAQHDAYVVDYLAEGKKRLAYFTVTEGVEYLIETLAPPEYLTKRQICDAYDIPLYLFDTYAEGQEPVGDFLSNAPSANVGLMPHFSPEQIMHLLENQAMDIADVPMSLSELASQSGSTPKTVEDTLARHGVRIGDNRTVSRLAGLRYLKQCQEIGEVDQTHTPTLNLMRTREARGSDLTHAEVTAMCHELIIPTTLQWDPETKRVRQCIPTEQLLQLQEAIQRYYQRHKRR